MSDDPKLPDPPRRASQRRTRNEWVASDRKERAKMIAVICFVAFLLGVGIWLVILGSKS